MKSCCFLFLSLILPAFPSLNAQPIGRGSTVKSGTETATVDLSGFAADSAEGRVFFDSLRNNLRITSAFREAPPSQAEFSIGGDARAVNGQLSVAFRVLERASGAQKLGKQYTVDSRQAAQLGRLLVDELTQSLHGRPGFASKRIVMVGQLPGQARKEVFAVYPDGKDLVQLTRDNAHVLAPEWAPDALSITYVSYHRGFPDVFRHHLSPPRREILANYAGLNTGGSISPDGRHSALILSNLGKPELFVRDLASGRMTRVTNTPNSPKSSPTWSPDGQQIAFVSGHEGRPHLYTVSRNGGAPRRISSGGAENLSPDWGSNGWIAFTRKAGPRYQIALLNPASGEIRIASPADADYEDPSWAPDGRHIVASRSVAGQSALYLLDTGGGAPIALLANQGRWYMPDWASK